MFLGNIRNGPGRGLSAVLMCALLIAVFHGNLESEAAQLGNGRLSQSNGGISFWKDPCTWDGFLFGFGAINCIAGNILACGSAAIGFLKAWKADDCFE